MEVHHRHHDRDLVRPVRDHPDLCSRRARARRDLGCDELVGDQHHRVAPRSGDRPDRLHLRDGRIRDQGRPRADAHVAARRAQPGPHAGVRAAVGCVLILFGLVSVLVAVPFLLAQRDVKRLLGYSSVEHVGVIALGLGFGGKLGTYAALLHTLSHGVAKALVFCAAGDAVQRCGSRDVQAIRGLLAAAPWAGTLLLLGILALAGMPPSAIFISELLVIRSGILDHPGVVAGVLAAMVAIFAGLIHQVGRMVYGEPGAVRRGEARGVDTGGARRRPRARDGGGRWLTSPSGSGVCSVGGSR
ncbi:MAG: hypothetical protein E6J91_15755 [Deltaproteobacteria bacterium]|nr:MAG: hypothetical protein E6J91_15755 [Deltaproteobacteria bacterium]